MIIAAATCEQRRLHIEQAKTEAAGSVAATTCLGKPECAVTAIWLLGCAGAAGGIGQPLALLLKTWVCC